MVDDLYIKIKNFEIEMKNKMTKKSLFECSFRAFKFINDNINKIKSEHILSVLKIINYYLLGTKFPCKNEISYELEEKVNKEYVKLIINDHFIRTKNEYKQKMQKEKDDMLFELENKFFNLVNSNKSKLDIHKDFYFIYYELIFLLNIMKLKIENMYFIKNILLFMKHHGYDENELISLSNVNEMLYEYDRKVKRK